jgi:hypothetical protein
MFILHVERTVLRDVSGVENRLEGSVPEVGRPLFWFAGPLSAAQQTIEMIADQRTGKNSGPALADYRNGAYAIPLFCIF